MKKIKSFLRGLALLLVLAVILAAWIVLPWPALLGAAVLFGLWMAFTRSGRQAASVTQVGISTLNQRIGASSVVVIGIAGVVGVLVALLAMGEGYRQTVSNSGSEDTAIVLRGGSSAELGSVLSRDQISAIERAPQIARDAQGRPLASAELMVAATVPLKGSKDDGNASLRGVSEMAYAVRPKLKLVAGRRFEPGRRELVVGTGAQRQFDGLEVGKQVRLGNQPWTVVGVFDSQDATASEMWADAEVVAATYRRGSSRAALYAKLTSAKDFNAFKATLAADPRLQVEADTTLAYFGKQSEGLTKVLRIIGIVVGSIMAIGAVFGALNTMFATVASRAREIATLRAIGFRGIPVVVAVMLETMLLALLGGVLGGLVGVAVVDAHDH
nr:ABC transporter permease [Thermomonas sp.]